MKLIFRWLVLALLVSSLCAQSRNTAPAPTPDAPEDEQRRQEARMVAFDEFRREYMTPIYAEKKRRRDLNPGKIVPQTDPSGPLLGDEAFEKKLWKRLSADVVARRDLNKLNSEIQRIEAVKRDFAKEPDDVKRLAGFAECDKQLRNLIPKRDDMEDADGRAATIALHLREMYDVRTIRLLAPLIFENDYESFIGEDYAKSSFTFRKIDALRTLQRFGVITTETPPVNHQAADEEMARPWREWWMKNKEQFGPVYELPKAAAALPAPQKPEPERAQKTSATNEPMQKAAPVTQPPQAEEIPAKSNWWVWAVLMAALFLIGFAAWRGKPASGAK
jgi:hypothetical protein